MQRLSAVRARRGGFTLVEMLVVLGILVLLASMVVPRILGSQKKADIQNTKAQIANLRKALELYATDCKDFPATEAGLEALVAEPADLLPNVTWDGPYIESELPIDPWGNQYQYEYPSVHGSTGPDIWSFGPDQEDGTEDDICNWNRAAESGEEGIVSSDTKESPRAKSRTKSEELPVVSSEPTASKSKRASKSTRSAIPEE